MAWPHLSPVNKSVLATLSYSDRFDFPLKLDELWYWQIKTHFSKSNFQSWPHYHSGFYYLPSRKNLVRIRLNRQKYSQSKFRLARRWSSRLKYLPTVRAIYVTGSLAMNNSPANDDIDLMIITTTGSLWFTRFMIVILLRLLNARRHPRLPEHASVRVSDKICDNLYLDSDHLGLSEHNLYIAHEVLQAKCLFDRDGIQHQFLISNSWVKDYLPVAYRESLKQFNNVTIQQFNSPQFINILKFMVNFFFFIVQYLYMRPRLTSEKIGLGYAFFHPGQTKAS